MMIINGLQAINHADFVAKKQLIQKYVALTTHSLYKVHILWHLHGDGESVWDKNWDWGDVAICSRKLVLIIRTYNIHN